MSENVIVEFEDSVVIGQYGFMNIHWVYDPFGNEFDLVFDMISSSEEGLHLQNVMFSDEFYKVFRALVRSKPEEVIQKYYKGINKQVMKQAISKVAKPIGYWF